MTAALRPAASATRLNVNVTTSRRLHAEAPVGESLVDASICDSSCRRVTNVKVVVTGGAGFIGSGVARVLARANEVISIDDFSTGRAENLHGSQVHSIEGSILDSPGLEAALADTDVVVHLAARPSVPRSIADPVASHEANATGTVRVLEAARAGGDPVVIVASSSSVYGANPTLPKHEGLAVMPLSPYAVSKLATEQYALAWQHSYGLRTLALRFFNVFGPRQAPDHAYAAVIPSFLAAALRGQPLMIQGDGTQTRDFTHVETVAEIICRAATEGVSHDQPVNLAFGTRTSLLEVIAMLESIIGRPLERNHVEPRPGDVPHSQADNALLRSLFPGVSPISLEDGLRQTVEWMDGYLAAASTDRPASTFDGTNGSG